MEYLILEGRERLQLKARGNPKKGFQTETINWKGRFKKDERSLLSEYAISATFKCLFEGF